VRILGLANLHQTPGASPDDADGQVHFVHLDDGGPAEPPSQPVNRDSAGLILHGGPSDRTMQHT
jgi:hypothetical protein